MEANARVPEETEAWLAVAQLASAGSEDWLRAAALAGSAAALFAAEPGALCQAGLSEAAIRRLRSFDGWREIESLRACCAKNRIEFVSIAAGGYPAALRRIQDPPVVLYYRGREPSVFDGGVAMVGARRATRYGCRMAHAIARRLAAAGVTVVSGLAYGIDRAAHDGALQAGATVAVLAGGLDNVYPSRHRALFERLVAEHCVISEYPPGIPALARHFPVRNRIITGMTTATIVVEAGERSGSLVSARAALDQGRDVYAVPGNADSPVSRGTNALLRDGAPMLACAKDVDDAFGLSSEAGAVGVLGPENASPAVGAGARGWAAVPGPDHLDLRRVWEVLQSEPRHVDEIVAETRLDGARVLELLTGLEIRGLASCAGPGMFTSLRPPS